MKIIGPGTSSRFLRRSIAKLVLLGGYLGSGRRVIAPRIAQKLGFHYYNFDGDKFQYFIRDSSGMRQESSNPETDAAIRHLYERVAGKLPLLAKLYDGVVMEDSFHRKVPREFFFSEVRKHFADVVFVWITSEEEYVRKRFERLKQLQILSSVEKSQAVRRTQMRAFQRFRSKPPIFHCYVVNEDTIQKLYECIKNQEASADILESL